MKFPKWANSGRMTKAERASGRLRYMVNILAAETSAANSILAIATEIGVDYSTIISYIIKGKFSVQMADKLEARFGPDLAPSWALQDPLSIQAD